MSWSSKRKTTYLSILGLIILSVASFVYYFYFYQAPGCFDGKQNQNEEGIDCGGVCTAVCSFQVVDPVVLWTRAFKVVDGIYNVVAFVENANTDDMALDVPYSFKLYDDQNILIAERRGRIDIPPHSFVPVFERTVDTGHREPARNPFFSFTGNVNWQKSPVDTPVLGVKNKTLTNLDSSPKLEADIENPTVNDIDNITLTAIISGSDGNAVAVSQTVIDRLPKKGTQKVAFTWNEPFSVDSPVIEVFPIIAIEK